MTTADTNAMMTRANRIFLRCTAGVTLALAAWYAAAWFLGSDEQANYAMLGLFASTIAWTTVLYENLVAEPIRARLEADGTGSAAP